MKDIVTVIIGLWILILFVPIIFILFFTAPVWAIPYIIYCQRKNNE